MNDTIDTNNVGDNEHNDNKTTIGISDDEHNDNKTTIGITDSSVAGLTTTDASCSTSVLIDSNETNDTNNHTTVESTDKK
jgi:hypothetical protein